MPFSASSCRFSRSPPVSGRTSSRLFSRLCSQADWPSKARVEFIAPKITSSRMRLGRSSRTVSDPWTPSGVARRAVRTIEWIARIFAISPRAATFFAMIASTVWACALTASPQAARAKIAGRNFIVPPERGPSSWDPCRPHAANVDGSLDKPEVHDLLAGKKPAMSSEAPARAHRIEAREVLKQVDLLKDCFSLRGWQLAQQSENFCGPDNRNSHLPRALLG